MIEETEDKFTVLFNKHLDKSYELAKSMLKMGKNETSAIIKHRLTHKPGKSELITDLTVLPIRRVYKEGNKIVDDEYLFHEIVEEVE